jgi:hypothetical protein
MKITKQQLKKIIREELMKETKWYDLEKERPPPHSKRVDTPREKLQKWYRNNPGIEIEFLDRDTEGKVSGRVKISKDLGTYEDWPKAHQAIIAAGIQITKPPQPHSMDQPEFSADDPRRREP